MSGHTYTHNTHRTTTVTLAVGLIITYSTCIYELRPSITNMCYPALLQACPTGALHTSSIELPSLPSHTSMHAVCAM